MTGENVPRISQETADEIHARAVDWLLAREDAEAWSEQDQAQLDSWLNESSAHLLAYWRAKSGWRRTDVLAAMRPFRPQNATTTTRERWTRWRLSIVAASIIAVVVASAIAAYWNTPRYQTYATAVGGRETLMLGDGSEVELNTDTVVRVPKGAGRRQIILDKGEAYFQIKHDVQNPFVVETGDGRVVDLGTEFVVRQCPNNVQVALISGSARYEGAASGGMRRSVILTPGDVVLATVDSVSLAKKPASDLQIALGWRQGKLIFRHATLADAVAEFNRYNDEKLMLGDTSIGRLEIRGTFRTADVALFATMAKQALGLQALRRGDEIIITR
jgi:transmembrane sensor